MLEAIQARILNRSLAGWTTKHIQVDRLGTGFYAGSIALDGPGRTRGHFNFECNDAPGIGLVFLDDVLRDAWAFEACPEMVHAPLSYSRAQAVADGIARDKSTLIALGIAVGKGPDGAPMSWDDVQRAFAKIADVSRTLDKQS